MNTLPRPIGRVEFLARWIAVGVVGRLLYELFSRALDFAEAHGTMMIAIGIVGALLYVLLLVWVIRFVFIARLVSIGWNRWYVLLILVPFVQALFMLFLLFCPACKLRNALEPTAPA